ncbi:MAG: NAD-dependent epimerase/dehydratase family protein [Clostridia bacterium]|nr:NAD-dependent epimerase/dehydratase family protein [Clostridia bacterium]
MKVFIVGGTGLLGSVAAEEFIKKGHSVKTIALPGLPKGANIPQEMEIVFGNFIEMTDEEIGALMDGCDCFVFAAGVDERVEFPAPVYPQYEKYNINPVKRFLTIAKNAGVTKAVILGSYFAYLNRIRPDMKLTEIHPYIRSRVEQEKAAFSFADDKMSVAVLELPYIFGAQPGRKPVWNIYVEKLLGMGPITFWPKGGTAALTTRQVGQAIVGAAEKNVGANAYPVGTVNYTWKQLMTKMHIGMGFPNRKFYHIPEFMFRAYAYFLQKAAEKQGLEPGLNYIELSRIEYVEVFIDTKIAKELGVTYDDVDAAVIDSMRVAMDSMKNEGEYIGMRAE